MPEFLSAPGSPDDLEHKAVAADPGSGLLNADEATGVVEALVSVTGVPDEVNDVIVPGAYADTLKTRKPKGIFAHDWNKWVARTEDIKELMPGDAMLPKQTRDGKPWPAAAGALYVKARFNLDTQEGRDRFSDVRFFSKTGECEWSVGFKVPAGKSTRDRAGTRHIKQMQLFEYSPVLFGAAPLSGTLSVKDAKAAKPSIMKDDEDSQAEILPDWTTDDPDDPITREADEDDPEMQALHEQAIREMNEAPAGWDAIDAASAINPGEEEITSDTASALQAADQRRQGSKGITPDDLESKAAAGASVPVSVKPWSDFSPADYTNAQWYRACLIHDHPADVTAPDSIPKSAAKLPVREPDGTINVNAVHAAAGALNGARGGIDATPAQKRSAAGQLRGLYRKIGEMPPSSLQAKVLTSADVTGTPPTGPSGPAQLRAREAQAFTGNPGAYTLPQWHDATVVHQHPDGTLPASHEECSLPVATPGGALSIDGMHQAAQALAAGEPETATDAERHDGAVALLMLFRRSGETPPDTLQVKTAGHEMTPADAKATERLRQWYEHGGGATQIGWGVPGDFDKCVAIAGKHMDAAKARGWCQLRHHATTGFYAGHAPSEAAAHASAAIAGRKGILSMDDLTGDETGEQKTAGYDPALETGDYAGHLPGTEVKTITVGAPLEEHLDQVTTAVTTALGGTLPGPDGTPRRMVAVQGTWPDHVVATSYDTWATPADGESFRIPYQASQDGAVTLGTPEPVTLTLGDDTGTKDLSGDDTALSPLPVLVEHVTGFIRRGLTMEVKQGRVLSDSNARLLQGAVDQLIMVLGSAGIQVGVKAGQEPDEDERALNEQESAPLYLPDSTAPAAQVDSQKMLLDPTLLARAYRITAAAAASRGD